MLCFCRILLTLFETLAYSISSILFFVGVSFSGGLEEGRVWVATCSECSFEVFLFFIYLLGCGEFFIGAILITPSLCSSGWCEPNQHACMHKMDIMQCLLFTVVKQMGDQLENEDNMLSSSSHTYPHFLLTNIWKWLILLQWYSKSIDAGEETSVMSSVSATQKYAVRIIWRRVRFDAYMKFVVFFLGAI